MLEQAIAHIKAFEQKWLTAKVKPWLKARERAARDKKKEKQQGAAELTRTLELERARYRENEGKYLAQLKEMNNRPVEVAVQEPDAQTLERIRAEERERAQSELAQAKEAARREAFEQMKEQKHKAEEQASKAIEREKKRAEEAEARAKAAEQEQAALAGNREQLEEAQQRARELEQRLQVAENAVSLRIQFCFEQIQQQMDQVAACLAEAPADDASKYRAAAKALLEQLAEEV